MPPLTEPTRRLPNFFLAGVPRSGTTSLYSYLAQHPEIYLSPIKEPTFFGAADLLSGPSRDRVLAHTARDLAALEPYLRRAPRPGPQPLVLDRHGYLALFREARNERAIGEGSVSYFALPGAARAIRAELPHARLIFVLRDPAERLFSRYLNAPDSGTRPTFPEWFSREISQRDPWPPTLDAGRYATHLQRFFDAFPPEQLRIYLYEDYRTDARALLRDLFGFLGVRQDLPVDLSRRLNETMVPRYPRLQAIARRLLGPTLSTRWMPRGAQRVVRRISQARPPQRMLDPQDRQMVIEHYADEIRHTATLIGRDLSAWLR